MKQIFKADSRSPSIYMDEPRCSRMVSSSELLIVKSGRNLERKTYICEREQIHCHLKPWLEFNK